MVAIPRGAVPMGRVIAELKARHGSQLDMGKASGLVKRLFVDYGDTVKEGQVLAELDREQLEAAVREAGANLLAAEASWERNKIEAEGPDLPFLKSALERLSDEHPFLLSGRYATDRAEVRYWEEASGGSDKVTLSGLFFQQGQLEIVVRASGSRRGNASSNRSTAQRSPRARNSTRARRPSTASSFPRKSPVAWL